MQRKRVMEKWSAYSHFPHRNQADFLSATPQPGVHTIMYNGIPLDILIEDRGSATTLVMFHASLSDSATRIPAFKGMGVARDSGVNLVSVADPTIGLGDINLAWFLGNSATGYLPPVLSRLIQHALTSLSTKRTVLFGTSGGGYAATNFGQYFPDCIVLAAVPRLDLTSKPKADVETFLNVAAKNSSKEEKNAIREKYFKNPLHELYSRKNLNFDLCLFQNLGDTTFMNYQVIPFVEEMSDNPRLFTRVEWYGRSHIIIPGKPYREIIRTFASVESQREAILRAGFAPVVQDMTKLSE